jgi:hypothetical protein
LSDGGSKAEDASPKARIAATRSVDPGDQTERNYRYQHQYGVVLLAAIRRGVRDYISIYCEHHEDFLCERADGLFDGYQVKTSKPEGGAWTLTSPPLVKSIGRFIELAGAYPEQLGTFFFVSNSELDSVTPASTDDARRGRCPGLMLQHLKSCASVETVQEPYRKPFLALAAALGVEPVRLFDVFQRLEFIKGPSREEFDASLAHEHLGVLPECADLATGQLRDLCNDLVALFHRAASLYVPDPDRHLRGLFSQDVDPAIAAKRIVCSEVVFVNSDAPVRSFTYQGEPTIVLGGARPKGVLEQKLSRGGLDDAVDYMKAREQAAEYHFLEEQAKNSQTASRQLRQIEEAVHGECLEAYMAAKVPGQVFGTAMFNDVTERLRKLETDRRGLLGGHPYEVLMGTAALLTSECRVWWSERFKLRGGQE